MASILSWLFTSVIQEHHLRAFYAHLMREIKALMVSGPVAFCSSRVDNRESNGAEVSLHYEVLTTLPFFNT